jgi:hypothetical protein
MTTKKEWRDLRKVAGVSTHHRFLQLIDMLVSGYFVAWLLRFNKRPIADPEKVVIFGKTFRMWTGYA